MTMTHDDDNDWYSDYLGPVSIFESDTVPDEGMIRSPMSPRVDGVNLGQSVILRSIDSDPYPVPEEEWFTFRGLVGLTRILTIRPTDLMSQSPGSWVISLNASILEPNTFPLPSAGVQEYVPIVAKVTYGTGGVSSYFEVDAWRSLFSVPSNDFIVEVGWRVVGTDILPDDQPPGIYFPIAIPDAIQVTATAHRSLETGESIPTCSFMLPLNGEAGGIIQRTVNVPPQAVSWCLSLGGTPALGAALGSAAVTSGSGGTYVDTLDSTQLVSMIRGQCFRPLSGLADSIELNLDITSITTGLTNPLNYALLTFRLGV